MTRSLEPRHLRAALQPPLRTALALGCLVFSAVVSADPLNLDFGPLGPSHHNAGAIDAGINLTKLGNGTAAGIPVGAAVTFSVPEGIRVDRMTFTYLSNSASLGPFLTQRLLAPNASSVTQLEANGTEVDFSGLAINEPASVAASFSVDRHPDFESAIDAYFPLRIDASPVASAVPEPAAVTMCAAGMAGLLLIRRRQARPA